jgi:hypothetical protein
VDNLQKVHYNILMPGDDVLNAYVDVFGSFPDEGDPIAALRQTYYPQVDAYAATGTRDPLVSALGDVWGMEPPATGDPILYFLVNGGSPPDMTIRVACNRQTGMAYMIYADAQYVGQLAIVGDQLVNMNTGLLNLHIDSSGALIQET